MKKAKLSKFLSLVLTLCMAFQLAPVIAPQAQATDVADIEISLLNIANGGAAAESISAFENYNSEKNADLVWYYDKDGSDVTATQVFNAQTRTVVNKDDKFQLKFYAEKAGAYNLKVSAFILPTVSIGVEGVSNTVTLAQVESAETVDVGKVNVHEGWNTLAITGTLAAKKDVWLEKITLTYVSDELIPVEFNLDFLAPITSGWGDAAFNEFTAYNQDYAEKTWKFLSSESNYIPAGAGTGNTIRFNLNAANKWIAFDFEVPIEGYYIPTLGYQGSGADGMTAKLAVDGNVIGTVDTTANATNNTKTFEEGIKLTAGTHKLVVSRSSASGSYFCLRNLKFAPATQPTEVAAKEKIIDFVDYARSHTAHEQGFVGATLDTYGWALSDKSSASVLTNANTKSYKSGGSASGLINMLAVGDTVVFDFKVFADGYYKVSFDTIDGPSCDVYVDGVYIGSPETIGDGVEIGGTNLTGGDTHKIAVVAKSDNRRWNPKAIRFTPTTASEVETPVADAVFGTKYAYVYKTDSGYQIDFVGGIKNINYSEVGFEISVDGAAAYDKKDTSVYEKISLNGTVYLPSDFGADNGHIFYVSDSISADAVNVTIKPYVMKDGQKVYREDDKSYTINLASLK